MADDYTKLQARIKTKHGDMVVRFLPNVAPNHVRNFVELARAGKYNGVIFHRVIKNFMIQGGDPTGTGSGGSTWDGNPLKAEFNATPHEKGILSMARTSNPDSGRSQFFVVHGTHDEVGYLDNQYTVFGKLASGLDVLDKIATAKTGASDRPLDPVKMDSVTIENV